jgi:hypothetical protein
MDIDDTDGAGPEIINLAQPEGTKDTPLSYSVGVHYWNDHGYGPSFATIALYMQGTLALQINKLKMEVLDMWYVGKLNWPNQLNAQKLPVLTQCLQEKGLTCFGDVPKTPKSCAAQAACGQKWKASGDYCITKCYENQAFTAQAQGAKPAQCKLGP